MKRILPLVCFLLLPASLLGAEIKGVIVKVDKAENRLMLKTERGEEAYFTTKSTKGLENLKEGAKVMIIFSEKDGQPKISEITMDK
jgi:Cu/Ag efflux protein CusF